MNSAESKLLQRLGASWASMLRDVVIVVLSILIAFALDAWWQTRLERRDEREVLASLRTEMEANRLQMERTLQIHNWALEASDSILTLTGPNAPPPGDPAALESHLMHLLLEPSFNPSFGALNALTASGRLAIVSDDSLRAALASWPGQVEDLQEDELTGRRIVREQLMSVMNRYVPGRSLIVRSPVIMDLVGDRVTLRPSRFAAAHAGLLRDPEFEGILANRHLNLIAVLREAEVLSERLEGILEMIDAELGEANPVS